MKKYFKSEYSKVILVLVIGCLALLALWADNLQYQKKLANETALVDHIDDFGDTTDVVTIEGDEVPLAKPKVTTKTSTETKTKKYKLKKAVKKASTSSKTSTKTKTKTKESADKKVVTKTTVKTTVQTTLKEKTKTVKTTIKTTIRTTTTAKSQGSGRMAAGGSIKNGHAKKIDDLQGIIDEDIIAVFKDLGFKVEVNSREARERGYSGCFSPSRKKIILARGDTATLIHEVGHFVSFIKFGGDSEKDFLTVYNKEKSKASKFYRMPGYTTSSRHEYFAETVSTFYVNDKKLKSSCPKTYAYMESVIASISLEDSKNVKNRYGW